MLIRNGFLASDTPRLQITSNYAHNISHFCCLLVCGTDATVSAESVCTKGISLQTSFHLRAINLMGRRNQLGNRWVLAYDSLSWGLAFGGSRRTRSHCAIGLAGRPAASVLGERCSSTQIPEMGLPDGLCSYSFAAESETPPSAMIFLSACTTPEPEVVLHC